MNVSINTTSLVSFLSGQSVAVLVMRGASSPRHFEGDQKGKEDLLEMFNRYPATEVDGGVVFDEHVVFFVPTKGHRNYIREHGEELAYHGNNLISRADKDRLLKEIEEEEARLAEKKARLAKL